MTRQTTRQMLGNKTLSHKTRLMALLTTTALVSTAALAQSLPTGGQVAAGNATIGSPSAGALTINQTSGSAVVNWQSFDVGKGNRVTFVQPDANAAILNRVTGQTSSTIAGQINANGQVYLINPNGIAITNSGTVKAGAFVASTLGISDDDFMAGKRTFTGNGASKDVTNAGTITINRGGYMALIGGTVANSGVITVPMGKAALGSGERATLDLSGDGFLQVAVPTKAGGKQALVDNSGRISARGGTVQLTAAAARDMARQAVNMSGTIEARGVSGRSGDIVLSGGDGEVAISGKVDASSRRGSGGKVEVTGRKITLANAKINASGKVGGGTVNIGGNRQGKGPLQHAGTLTVDANTVINADAVTTGNGGNVVLWSDDLTRFAGTITAKGGSVSGNGGEVEVSGKAKLSYAGLTDLTAAHGSFGNLLLDPYNVTISTATDSNSSGFTASGNDSIINVNTLTNALATANVTVTTGSSGSQAGTITVAAPINWGALTTLTLSAASDININAAITATTGGLTLASGGNINVPAAVSIGGAFNLTSGNWVQNTAALPTFSAKDFQLTGGSFLRVTGGDGTSTTPYTVTDVYGLQGIGSSSAYLASYWTLANDIDASGTTTWNGGSGFNPIGNINSAFTGNVDGLGHVISGLTINRPSVDNVGLFGFTGSSTISNIGLVGGSIIGGYDVGALVGRSDSLISNVYSTNSVMGSYTPVGGLVGLNYGTISHAYSTGAVSGSSMVGGLAGQNWGTISSSYATGAVSGSGTVGGLVGANNVTITNTYATGAVSALHGDGGGLVGVNYSSGAIVASYWDQTTTGQSTSVGYNFSGTTAGVTGIALADAFTQSTYAGFDFTNDWFIVAGATRPFLRSEWSTTVANSHQLQLMSMNLGAAYSLVANIDLASDLANRSSMWRTAPDFLFQSGFIPIGTNSGDFTGSFDGRGHTISNLAVITLGSAGLFRATGSSALISNVGLVGGSISGGDQATSGGLVASNVGSIVNAYSSVAVKGGNVGGLVGGNAINGNNVGKITRSYSTGSVTGLNTGSYQGGSNPGDNGYAGGLVGMNQGSITESYATGTVTDASAAPVVGGFVGVNLGWITDAYAAGGVSSSGNGPAYVGGFVGINRGSELVNAYATGVPTAAGDQSHVGGFAGAPSGNELNTFWDVTTSRTTIGDGVNFSGSTGFSGYIGLTSAQMADPFSFINAGWDFANVWGKSTSGANNGFMMLRSLSSGLYDDYVKIGSGTRIYGDANSTITGATLSGVGTGNVSLAWGSAIAGTTNAGTYNYSDPNIVSVTENGPRTAYIDYGGALTISQRVLSLTGGRTYDGTTDVAATNLSLGNLANGDTLTLAGAGSMVDKNVGTGKALSLGTLALGNSINGDGGLASNYTLIGGTGIVDITRATISSISGITASGKTYDGNTTATLNTSGAGFIGMFGGDVLTVATSAGTFSDKNAGAGKAVGITGLTLGGTDAGNYTLASSTATTTGDITKAYVFFGGISANTKVYDGTTAASVNIYTIPISGDDMHVGYTSANFSDKNAGMSKAVAVDGLYITGADAGNYQLGITNATSYGTITPAIITSIGGITAGNKTYDGTTDAPLDTSGAVFNGMIQGDNLTVATALGAFSDKNVGAGKTVDISDLTLGGADAYNYRLNINTASAIANIGQRVISLSGRRTYNGSVNLDASIFALSNLVSGETLTLSGTGTMADKNAGSGKAVMLASLMLGDSINGDGGVASNYTLIGGADTVDIAKATISAISGITAGNKTYDGSANATLNTSGAGFIGMVGGDALTVATSIGTFSDKNAGAGKAVGISGLALGGTDAGNYELADTVATTTADISQRVINLSGSRTYNGSADLAASIFTLSNLVGNETLTLSGTGSMADKNVGSGKAVTLGSLALGNGGNGGLASNYMLGTGTVDIARATISSISGITANGKTYDGNAGATLNTGGAIFNGKVDGDSLGLGNGYSGLFSDANTGIGKTVAISGLSLSGADAGNYTLADTTATTLANIGQRVITLSGSRIYDGTTVLDNSIFSLSNLVGNETLTLSGTGSMGDKNAGSGKAVTLGSLALANGGNGGLASNYTLGTGTVDIARATISSISGITANGKTYDGNAGATLNTGGAIFNGKVDGDSLGLGNGYSGLFSDANTGIGKTVAISGLSLSGADAGNYTLASSTATTLANIGQRVITLSGSRIYNGTTDLASTIFSLSNLVGNETLTLSGTGSMADKNAGSGKAVTLGSLALGNGGNGGLASNYSLGTGTVDIARATISSISGITANGKTYDGNTGATLDPSGATFNGIFGNDVLTVSGGLGAFADANAGTGKTVAISGLGLSGADAGNYTLADTTATTLANIGQRILTLSGSRIYNGTTVLDNSIFSLSNLVGNETLTLSGTGSMADKNVGSGKAVTLGLLTLGNGGDGGLASNYTLGTGTVDIARATISSISGITANGKTYDGNAGATLDPSGATFNGIFGNDVLTVSGGLGVFADANAGTGKTVTISGLGLSGADAGNYALADATGTTLGDIARRAITVTANAASRAYGDANPTLTYTVGGAGLVNGDSLSGALSTSAMQHSNVGTYAISQGSLGNANYTITYSDADLTVTPRAITVVANAASRAYGDANPALTYAIGGAGLVNGDGLTGGLVTSAVATSGVGSYGIAQGSIAASGNYDLTFLGGTLSVTPRAITVAANGANRTYGDADPVFTYVATGLVNGDTLAGDLSSAANRFSNVGSYTIGLGTLGNANYAITYTGARLTITPRLISAIANNASRAAGAANPLFSYTIAGGGLVNGDRLFGQLASTADRFSIPGSYAIDQGSLAASANYDLSFVRGVLTVTAPPSSPTADLASAIVPRSYAPDAAPPLPPVPADDHGRFSYTDEGRRVFLTDPRFAGTVVCLGDGTGCLVQAIP